VADRVKGFAVTLDHDYHAEDAEQIAKALRMIRGIVDVSPVTDSIIRVDFSALPGGAQGPPEEHAGLKIYACSEDGQLAGHVVERYGIRGLDCGTRAVIEFAAPARTVNLEIAHFGTPPSIKVLDVSGQVVAELATDPRPRQIERLRAVGNDIRKVFIDARRGPAVLVAVSVQPSG
jgi:hypothetical protein